MELVLLFGLAACFGLVDRFTRTIGPNIITTDIITVVMINSAIVKAVFSILNKLSPF